MKFSFEVLSGHVRRDEGVRTTAQDIAASDSMKQPLPRFHGIARGKILAFAVGLEIVRFFYTTWYLCIRQHPRRYYMGGSQRWLFMNSSTLGIESDDVDISGRTDGMMSNETLKGIYNQ